MSPPKQVAVIYTSITSALLQRQPDFSETWHEILLTVLKSCVRIHRVA